MSDIFKTKEVRYIDDCRMLNYAECMGLITNGIIFKKFNIINKYNFDYLFLEEFLEGQINKYTMKCIPETKETLIEMYTFYNQYEIYFVPKDTYIKINILNKDYKRIAYIDYSVEELEDLLM